MIERQRGLSIGMAALEPDERCGQSDLGDGYLDPAVVLRFVASSFFAYSSAAIS